MGDPCLCLVTASGLNAAGEIAIRDALWVAGQSHTLIIFVLVILSGIR